jgi:AraC family transcriptional regulator, transcriptional activator of pobA
VQFEDENHAITQRGAFSFPAAIAPGLALDPGAEAILIGLSPELLIDAIGNKAESVLLRTFTERPAIVTRETASDDTFNDVAQLARGFTNEVTRPGHGSDMAIAAFARLILMTLWRTGEWSAPAVTGHGLDIAILQRYRQLVELHFRERRSLDFYARELGLSHDRLHAICTRTLSRTPKMLLQNRIMQEASLRLERSGSSIQQIATQLGFSDQTYFSHAYKRVTGLSPHEYRRRASQPDRQLARPATAVYFDWP